MEYDIFFECVAGFIHKIDTRFRIIRVNLTTTSVHRKEYRLDTGSRLRHQTGCSCRSNSQTSNVTTTVLQHIFIQSRISFTQTVDKRILFLTFRIIDFESATLFSHHDGRTISLQSQCLLDFFSTLCCLIRSVTKSQSRNHIAFSSDTHTGTTALQSLLLYLFPQMTFRFLHFH